MTSIGIIGSQGRMGVALVAAISEAGQRHGGVDKGGDVAKLVADSDVLVDFSSPAALEATLDICVAAKKPIVIGTTGLEDRHHYLIDDAARDIAVLQTGNMSLGVTLLAHLVREAASRLDADWDIELVEMHQRYRPAARPSGGRWARHRPRQMFGTRPRRHHRHARTWQDRLFQHPRRDRCGRP
jgi:4-hydroxy-tetrahydrodipicolinate reductase